MNIFFSVCLVSGVTAVSEWVKRSCRRALTQSRQA